MDTVMLGAGITRFHRESPCSMEELGREAVLSAFADAAIERAAVGAAYVGSFHGSGGEGQRILKDLGLTGIPIVNVENACATGSTALIEAVRAVEHGDVGVSLAVGVDVPSGPASGPASLRSEDPMVGLGLTGPALYAMRARRYMQAYGVTSEDIAAVSVKNRSHGSLNPIAVFRRPVELDEVLASPMIAEPLTRLQCCAVSSGAAAVIVGRAGTGAGRPRFRGAALRSGMLQDQVGGEDTLSSRTAEASYERAGIGPADIDLCEVHDAFTIGEVLAIEGLGLCPPGEGAGYVRAGRATLGGGGTVVNPSGGLLSRGHPPGATGVAQVVEAGLQLMGRAGPRQVEGCRVAVCHTRGGSNFDIEADACAVVVMGV